MTASYDRLVRFVDYIQRQKVVDGYYVDAALADWVSAEPVSGRITGTWGYYLTIRSMARIASLTGHAADAARYAALAEEIKSAFNRAFLNEAAGRYAGPEGPTQAAQALALDAGLVPEGSRGKVLDALVELIYNFHPNGTGPHLSGGTIGMGPIVRALMNGDRDDVLWGVLQQNDQPSYGYFMESTPANPGGMTTIGERWNRGDSKNHMILAQIEEWFHAGIAGIQTAPGSIAYDRLIFKPKPVGDLTKASGSYETPAGWARSAWTKKDGRFALSVTVPANTQAEVWVPATDIRLVTASSRTTFQRIDGAYVVYAVASGPHSFTVRTGS
jgi:alpha-L-rhamnosidase